MSSFDWREEHKKNYFETDASEVEDLYDSAGAEGLAEGPTSSIVKSELFSAPEEDRETDDQNISKPEGSHLHSEVKLPVQLSANGRIMLRKYFTETAPIELPRGHTLVASSEPQIHAVLKTISDETVKSSLHAMRSLDLQAVYGERVRPPENSEKP